MQTQISLIDHLASKKQTQPLAESIAHSFIKFYIPLKYLSLKVYQKKKIFTRKKIVFMQNRKINFSETNKQIAGLVVTFDFL